MLLLLLFQVTPTQTASSSNLLGSTDLHTATAQQQQRKCWHTLQPPHIAVHAS
jgi:hypothetical protein